MEDIRLPLKCYSRSAPQNDQAGKPLWKINLTAAPGGELHISIVLLQPGANQVTNAVNTWVFSRNWCRKLGPGRDRL